jgi:uncharacterized BrkB/YihY/UPF0761 family membrane protein
VASTTKLERRQARTAALEARAKRISDRAAQERSRHRSVDTVFEVADRDAEVAGGLLAGALAYRLFIWLLPFGLVLVAGLGLAASASSKSPADTAGSLGLAGLVSNSIASAAKGSSRWYALLIGFPALFWATRSVLRALIATHRLVWTDLRDTAPRPTATATARLLVLFLCLLAASALAAAARSWSGLAGLVTTLAVVVAYAGVWLLVSLQLPHREARWGELVPGAVFFGIGVDLLQVAAAYVLGPMALSKQGTYGALGIAAALLIGLYLLGRVIVDAAALNATLAERHGRSGASLEGSTGG